MCSQQKINQTVQIMKLSKLIFGVVLVLLVANTCLWFVFNGFQDKKCVDDPAAIVYSPPVDPVTVLQEQGFDFDTFSGLHSPSLRVKENVDFFLTPALLVQEAISEGVIITYPGE